MTDTKTLAERLRVQADWCEAEGALIQPSLVRKAAYALDSRDALLREALEVVAFSVVLIGHSDDPVTQVIADFRDKLDAFAAANKAGAP